MYLIQEGLVVGVVVVEEDDDQVVQTLDEDIQNRSRHLNKEQTQ
jgi:hypothetical protein